MEIRLAVPCILYSLPEVHMFLAPAEGSCMTLSPMHLAVAARRILTKHRDASQQSPGPARFLTLLYSTYLRRSASPQRSPHTNICEGALCHQPFHMSLLQPPLRPVLPDSPVTAAVVARRDRVAALHTPRTGAHVGERAHVADVPSALPLDSSGPPVRGHCALVISCSVAISEIPGAWILLGPLPWV